MAALRERGYDCASAPAYRFDEASGGNIYGLSTEVLMNGWIAYLIEPSPPLALRSSTIAVIAGESGRLVYVGCAHDER